MEPVSVCLLVHTCPFACEHWAQSNVVLPSNGALALSLHNAQMGTFSLTFSLTLLQCNDERVNIKKEKQKTGNRKKMTAPHAHTNQSAHSSQFLFKLFSLRLVTESFSFLLALFTTSSSLLQTQSSSFPSSSHFSPKQQAHDTSCMCVCGGITAAQHTLGVNGLLRLPFFATPLAHTGAHTHNE